MDHYSTTNKLFFVNPSPMMGNSGDSCHSPSTKNLISYLHNNYYFWVWRILEVIRWFQKLYKFRKTVPSWPEQQCCWKLCVRTIIFWWKMLSLAPAIKGSHNLHALMENESSNGQGISKYIQFLKPHYTIITSAMPIQNTETSFDCAASTSFICSFNFSCTAM